VELEATVESLITDLVLRNQAESDHGL
jgi:hypothetical protein